MQRDVVLQLHTQVLREDPGYEDGATTTNASLVPRPLSEKSRRGLATRSGHETTPMLVLQ